MKGRTYWSVVTKDTANLLDRFLAVLDTHGVGVRYCVIGGQAVNAYADPVISLDLDVVVAVEDHDAAEAALRRAFTVEAFPHSLNVSAPDSDLRIQLQTDPRYAPFVDRAEPRVVLGVRLPVARLQDVLTGKVWAVEDPTRRASKRQKDLADIARLLERRPDLRSQVPPAILEHLLQ